MGILLAVYQFLCGLSSHEPSEVGYYKAGPNVGMARLQCAVCGKYLGMRKRKA